MQSLSVLFMRRQLNNLRGLLSALASCEPWPVIATAARGHVRPMPEPMKRLTLRHYARRHGLRTFVETGTFRGETIEVMLPEMDEIHSVELSDELHAAAVQKFKRETKVHLHKGDSGKVLPGIVDGLTKPALIWLDAHYSAKVTAHGSEETPILAELRAVFGRSKSRHVILIDDAREFEDKSTYPALDEVRKIAEANGYNYECRFDLIRLTPSLLRQPVKTNSACI
jgi:hypothetical protein